ncbi:MAG: MG2 domain-containing protein [Chloroflexi bacterium]|nr:MG2 domain-containing protein [Chloroflexota bacterium]
MRRIWLKIATLILVGITMATVLPACQKISAADSYVAIVPSILHSGRAEAISLSLLNSGQLVKDIVEVTLLKDGQKITSASQTVNGNGTVTLDIPEVEEGKYEIQVKGTGFEDKASVSIEKSFLVFVETDKPIYKPGQTIQMRVLTLDSELKPVTEPATIEVLDDKGIKIFRTEVTTDEYGMAELELPISNEPNLGVWKINVITEKDKNELDVRVEEYVLPKYEVTVELSKEWFLVNEPIKGTIKAEYSFGKPVSGELEVEAVKYVGQWQSYATLTKEIDGEVEFELPAVGYVAGTPAGGGQGNIQLNVTVEEKSTGYVEKTSSLLTVAQSAVNLQLIPEGSVFKPGLPFSFLVITETPDNRPVDAKIETNITYSDSKFEDIGTEKQTLQTVKGKAILDINPPEGAIALSIEAFELTPVSSVSPAYASQVLQSSYSPSGNFIHLEQTSEGTPKVGQKIVFRVNSTNMAVNFYYEVISRGKVVFSDYTRNRDISFSTTPLMAPTSKLLVYQILPNSEVAADYLPFNVLAENRMNLQQVFDELERLYMEPQAEIHDVSFYPTVTTTGAADIFKNAGVVVMTNKKVPENKVYQAQGGGSFLDKIFNFFAGRGDAMLEKGAIVPAASSPTTTPTTSNSSSSGELAEVERVRQFFPETWLWFDVTTDASGKASKKVTVPDSITTWMLRAVAVSKDKGLGVAEDSLTVFQPFFLTIDLPYSSIRGEEFPVSVAVYNYLDATQSVQVGIEQSDWFDLLDESTKTIEVGANDIGSAQFMIRPTKIGTNEVKITARSSKEADAVIKTVVVEPEGVSHEIVDNLALSSSSTKTVDTSIPDNVVSDSGRAYIAVTSSFLTQTIDGLDALLQMPFGCGEQNMILFAPDVYITKYLQESGQLKPEIMAKAEKLMITGYQRELTYRRTDGSFSAFGMDDESGSLWLTAFVLKSFSQAKDLVYIDDSVLNDAVNWITSRQKSDGSFESVGFVHHQEMLGGVNGKDALTAYTAIALMEAGDKVNSGKAIAYLEGKLAEMTDPYTVAITTYALELAQSAKSEDAYKKLMSLAKEDENGLHWGSDIIEPEPLTKDGRMMPAFQPDINRSADIETTAYATLALVEYGDAFNASRSSRWLVSKRRAYGGYGSTQDTVVTLQALTEYAANAQADVDLTVTLKGDGIDKQLKINKDNFDVLQMVEVPVNAQINMTVEGKGDAIGQVVRRFNLPDVEDTAEQMLKIGVNYDTTEVEVNDLVKVSVSLEFNPLPELNIAEAGMTVLDVSVPTGFAPVTDSIVAVTQKLPNIKRYDIAGRKVIFYVENMKPGEKITFDFQVKALYPVKAKGVASQAYSYYKPDIKGEVLSAAVTVK